MTCVCVKHLQSSLRQQVFDATILPRPTIYTTYDMCCESDCGVNKGASVSATTLWTTKQRRRPVFTVICRWLQAVVQPTWPAIGGKLGLASLALAAAAPVPQ